MTRPASRPSTHNSEQRGLAGKFPFSPAPLPQAYYAATPPSPSPPPGVDEVVIGRADFVPPGAVPPGIWTNGTTLRSAITRYGSRTAAVFANSTCCIGTGGIFLRQLDRGPLVVGCQSASGWRRRLLEYYKIRKHSTVHIFTGENLAQ